MKAYIYKLGVFSKYILSTIKIEHYLHSRYFHNKKIIITKTTENLIHFINLEII